MVEEMGPKFDCDAMQRVERMAEEQKLALRVDRRSLDALAIPRPANLHAAMVRLDVQIIGHAHGFAGRIVENGKREQATPSLARKSLVDEFAELVGRRDRCVP